MTETILKPRRHRSNVFLQPPIGNTASWLWLRYNRHDGSSSLREHRPYGMDDRTMYLSTDETGVLIDILRHPPRDVMVEKLVIQTWNERPTLECYWQKGLVTRDFKLANGRYQLRRVSEAFFVLETHHPIETKNKRVFTHDEINKAINELFPSKPHLVVG